MLTHDLWLQVAAYTNGRNTVSEYDLLLLQHVLWQRPEEAQRIADYLLGQLASDSGGQIDMLLQGARGDALPLC
jgi:MoxR-like ATPase